MRTLTVWQAPARQASGQELATLPAKGGSLACKALQVSTGIHCSCCQLLWCFNAQEKGLPAPSPWKHSCRRLHKFWWVVELFGRLYFSKQNLPDRNSRISNVSRYAGIMVVDDVYTPWSSCIGQVWAVSDLRERQGAVPQLAHLPHCRDTAIPSPAPQEGLLG